MGQFSIQEITIFGSNFDANQQFRHQGVGDRIIIGEALIQREHTADAEAIQKAVLKALEWSDALLKGRAKTVTELAEKEGLSQRYLSSLMPLAWLSPNTIEGLAQAKVPAGLTLEKLKKGFPADWRAQDRFLGVLDHEIRASGQQHTGKQLSATSS